MNLLKIATLSMALLAVPATAQSLSDAHELRWSQAGKLPTATYHPIKRSCVQAAPVHLAGKTPYIVPANRTADCGKSIAAVNRESTKNVNLATD
jgi:hypothetical protein